MRSQQLAVMCINVLNKTCKNQLQPSDIQVFNYVQVSFVCVCVCLILGVWEADGAH